MELRRKCEDTIKQWYKKSKKALLIKGARQVGKTHIIRSVLDSVDCEYVEINLIEMPAAISVLEQITNVNQLITGLSTIINKKLIRGKTVIFIDEVQKYPEMVTKIKFLVDEGSFRYILSGSLLGIELHGLQSAPVGYMSIIDMYPLDFKEFLQISGVPDDTIEYLRESFENKTPVMDAVHDKMMDLFIQYLTVGGMPDAVCAFCETGSLNDVSVIHKDIKALYKLDFTQYEEKEKKLLISKAYDLIPSELLKQNKRFLISDLKKNEKYERVERTFLWLVNAGVALPAYNVGEPRIPFKISEKHSLFKLYSSDVGMLASEYGMSTKRSLITKDPHLNAGGIFENAVAQELISKGYNLYYYNSNRLGELDFVIEHNGHSLPIEVKSGKDYTIHSALNNCLKNEQYEMEEAVVFSGFNVSVNEKITYLPIYMVMFFDKDGEDMVLPRISFTE